MFEQLAHDIKTVIQAPFEEPEIKMGLIHEMIDKTIERKTMSNPPQPEPLEVGLSRLGNKVYFDVLTHEFKTIKEEK